MSTVRRSIEKWRAMGPSDWAESPHGWLVNGRPITLAPWQRAILDAWFSHHEDVSTLAISCIKKSGKTFANSILTCWRWLVLPGEHFVAGNDLDQSAGRVFREISDLCKRHPLLKGNTKIGKGLLTFEPTGSTIEPLAVDAAGNAGSNHATASHTECWGILHEGARRAFEELTPPPLDLYGFCALRITDSYAGWQGESELWHDLVDRGLTGERVSDEWPITLTTDGLMLFHMTGTEAQERCFRGSEKQRARYYDQQRASLRKNSYSRFHENERTGSELSFLPSIQLWDDLSDPSLYVSLAMPTETDIARNKHMRIWDPGKVVDLYPDAVLAMDASAGGLISHRAGDSFAMVVVSHLGNDATRYAVRHCVEIRPTPSMIDWVTVQEKFDAILERFNILCCVFDPFALESFFQRNRHKVMMVPFGQQTDRVLSDTNLYTAVGEKRIFHYGDPGLRKHILGCASKAQGGDGQALRLVKKSPFSHIDLAVATGMALWKAQRLNF